MSETAVLEAGHTLAGNFQRHEQWYSHALGAARDVLVYLPPGYDDEPERRYPVLYLHDGQNLFDGATSFVPGQEWRVDETAEELIRSGQVDPLLIVGVYHGNERRIDEYTPTHDKRMNQGGQARRHAQFLSRELKPFIDATYRTKPSPATTAVGGSSLGGLVSLWLGLHHPGTFGRVVAMSPSLWWDDRVLLKQAQRLKSKRRLRIWLDFGTQEVDNPDKSAKLLQDARDLKDILMEKGWLPGVDLLYHEEPGGTHTEESFGARVGPMLRFLFPPKRRTIAPRSPVW